MPFEPMMIGPVVVDALISEDHALPSETTEYPLEQGSNVSDNTRALARELSVEGMISDAPLGTDLQKLRVRETGGTIAPSEYAYALLEKIYTDREPVTVITSLRTYPSMVMLSCNVRRDKDTGRALSFTAAFKQITIVTNQRTVIRTDIRGAQNLNRGFRTGTPVYVQSFTDDKGNKESRVVYAVPNKSGPPDYVYADGSPKQNKYNQELTAVQKSQAKPVVLNKNTPHAVRPDQKRQAGKPYGPYIGGGKT